MILKSWQNKAAPLLAKKINWAELKKKTYQSLNFPMNQLISLIGGNETAIKICSTITKWVLKMKQLPIFLNVCLLRLVVSSSEIVFWALTACQTCASHDGEDFQAAGNEIRRRDGFSHVFNTALFRGISPSLTLVAVAAASVQSLTREGHDGVASPSCWTSTGLISFFWQQGCLISLVIMCWHQVDNMWVWYRSNGGGGNKC